MLADECPRNTCYGIPLVRPPTAGRDKDPRNVRLSQVILKKTDIVITTQNRSVLYVALSTSQKQKEGLKGGVP